ncbi:MAG TPA: hypothetical protein VHZ98_10735 [Galbitalea sp.]|nr:hypothetical protein [Galbitalea sp.]
MKLLINHNGQYLTGSAIADAVMSYALTLTRSGDVDSVDLPFRATDGAIKRVVLMLGWQVETTTVSGDDDSDELLEPGTVDSIRVRDHSRGTMRATVVDLGDHRQLQWSNFDL